MESGHNNNFFKKLLRGGENKETRNYSEELRRRLIRIRSDVEFWTVDMSSTSTPRMQKSHLEDMPVIPRIPYNNEKVKGDLIGEGVLRGEDLYIKRAPNDKYDGSPRDKEIYVYQNYDTIVIPNNFFKEGSVVVLLVPRFNQGKVEGYDITVIESQGKELVKLTGNEELDERTHHKVVTDQKDPLKIVESYILVEKPMPAPQIDKKDRYPQLTSTPFDPSGRTEVWIGGRLTTRNVYQDKSKPSLEDAEKRYKATVNGTTCYRLIEGYAERQKSLQKEPLPKLTPQLSSI